MSNDKPLVSFDYAIKYLLKDKGDYGIVEGFISALLKTRGYKDIKIGDEYLGVVVSSNQYGYITNSFGNLKGLLTFTDIE